MNQGELHCDNIYCLSKNIHGKYTNTYYYYTSFPSRNPWFFIFIHRQREYAGFVGYAYTPAKEAVYCTTWRNPHGASAPDGSLSVGPVFIIIIIILHAKVLITPHTFLGIALARCHLFLDCLSFFSTNSA